jgi:hypothetical protein
MSIVHEYMLLYRMKMGWFKKNFFWKVILIGSEASSFFKKEKLKILKVYIPLMYKQILHTYCKRKKDDCVNLESLPGSVLTLMIPESGYFFMEEAHQTFYV